MLAAAAAAAAAFNLVCTGTLYHKSYFDEGTEPYTYTYRIDLAHRKYCEEACGVLRDIADIHPVVLVLEPDKDIDTATKHEFFRTSIDRLSGHQTTLDTSGRGIDILIMKWEGQCERQPFTGFPTPQTKF